MKRVVAHRVLNKVYADQLKMVERYWFFVNELKLPPEIGEYVFAAASQVSMKIMRRLFIDYPRGATNVTEAIHYPNMTVVNLKRELRARRLKVSGKKAELVRRLCDDDAKSS
jgi:hypothetical protein